MVGGQLLSVAWEECIPYANMTPAGPAPTTQTSHFLRLLSIFSAGSTPLVLVMVISASRI